MFPNRERIPAFARQRGTDLLLCLQKLYATITHSGAFLLLSLLLLGSLHECFMMHEQLEAMAMEVNSEEMATRMAQEQVDRSFLFWWKTRTKTTQKKD